MQGGYEEVLDDGASKEEVLDEGVSEEELDDVATKFMLAIAEGKVGLEVLDKFPTPFGNTRLVAYTLVVVVP